MPRGLWALWGVLFALAVVAICVPGVPERHNRCDDYCSVPVTSVGVSNDGVYQDIRYLR